MSHVVAFDLETTGLDSTKHCIAEIGLIRTTSDLKTELCRLGTRVRIDDIASASPTALAIWGYTPEGWAEAPHLSYLIRTIWELCQGAVPLGYNVDFDLRFLNAAFARYGYARPWASTITIDAMRHASKLKRAGLIPSRKLANAAPYILSRCQGDLHRALDDAELALDIERVMRAGGPAPVQSVDRTEVVHAE